MHHQPEGASSAKSTRTNPALARGGRNRRAPSTAPRAMTDLFTRPPLARAVHCRVPDPSHRTNWAPHPTGLSRSIHLRDPDLLPQDPVSQRDPPVPCLRLSRPRTRTAQWVPLSTHSPHESSRRVAAPSQAPLLCHQPWLRRIFTGLRPSALTCLFPCPAPPSTFRGR